MDTPLAANLINLSLGILNLLIVIAAFVAIWMNKKQAEENKKQAEENWQHMQDLALKERQYQSRPIVVPVGGLAYPQLQSQHGTISAVEQNDAQNQIASVGAYWNADIQIELRNIGHGPAINVSYVFIDLTLNC